MKNKVKKVLCAIAVLALALAMSAMPVLATSATPAVDVAGTVEGLWGGINTQIKDIYNNVIVWVLDAIVAIWMVVEIVLAVIRYNNHEPVKLTKVILLVVALIIVASSPAWLPPLAGWN